jgi:hypothetical protein
VRRLLLLGLCLGLTGLAHAQSLGEVARRKQEQEKEKEKAQRTPASPAPTYTADDLKSSRGKSKGTVSELAMQGGAAPASPSPSPQAEPDRAVQERIWRTRFAEARMRIAEAESRAYEDRIETVFVAGIPVQQKVRVKVETEELRQARKALEDLEEELRRAGGLPGWGRGQ